MKEQFADRVIHLRQQFDEALSKGIFPDRLADEVAALEQEKDRLLTQALPRYRRKVLDTRDPGATLVPLVASRKDAPGGGFLSTAGTQLTQKDLDEAGLTPQEKHLCEQLLAGDPPDEPTIPEGCGYDPAAPSDSSGKNSANGEPAAVASPPDGNKASSPDENVQKLQNPFDMQKPANPYQASPYMSVASAGTCFLFLDDGSVVLFENNDGWQWRRAPILQECFAENAIMESEHSCLLVNLDHGIDRLSYRRIETAQDLMEEPLFAEGSSRQNE